eukprot:scaffold123909_cov56-Attheya_sp.AAC.1
MSTTRRRKRTLPYNGSTHNEVEDGNRCPTCSDFGPDRKVHYPDASFCSKCDDWDVTQATGGKGKRKSRRFKCQANLGPNWFTPSKKKQEWHANTIRNKPSGKTKRNEEEDRGDSLSQEESHHQTRRKYTMADDGSGIKVTVKFNDPLSSTGREPARSPPSDPLQQPPPSTTTEVIRPKAVPEPPSYFESPPPSTTTEVIRPKAVPEPPSYFESPPPSTTTEVIIHPKAVPEPPSYFDSPSARALFQPKPEETVIRCLQHRIDILSKVIDDWPNGMPELVDGQHDAFNEMNDTSKSRIYHKALYLRNAYIVALEIMGNGKSWRKACEQAIDSLAAVGIETYQRPGTICEFNQQFRQYKLFEIKSSTKSVTHVQLLAVFPEAHNMLMSWAKNNLQTLNSETAREYLLEKVIPKCCERCNNELRAMGVQHMDEADFMKFVGLKTLCASTAWRWIRLLGFTYRERRKCYYTDGHEKAENVRARINFIVQYFGLEIRTYRFVQLTEEAALDLEQLEKNPLEQGLARREWTAEDGIQMREYHIDCHPRLLHFVSEQNRTIHGGDLSVYLPEGVRPLLICGQDESVYYQYLFSSRAWHSHQGETTLVPKSLGNTLMASVFTGDQLGFGFRPTDNQIEEINSKKRQGQEYKSVASAKHLQQDSTSKPTLTKAMFDDDLVNSPFLKLFQFGAANEGYWTNHHVKLQFEDFIDCMQVVFPKHDIVTLFDQSSGHTYKRENGLDATKMNLSYGGKNTTPMRPSELTINDIGPYPSILKGGMLQLFDFPKAEDCSEDDGPFFLTKEERLATRHDKYEPPDTETKPKTYKELRVELVEKNLLNNRQRPREPVLLDLAKANNIAVEKH